MRTESDLPPLLNIVDSSNVFGQVSARSVGVVALVL